MEDFQELYVELIVSKYIFSLLSIALLYFLFNFSLVISFPYIISV